MLIEKQEQLFRRWLDEHKKLMFKVVRTYTDSPEDQDDLFQEILLQLWSSIPSFRGKAKESTWIYRVAMSGGVQPRPLPALVIYDSQAVYEDSLVVEMSSQV